MLHEKKEQKKLYDLGKLKMKRNIVISLVCRDSLFIDAITYYYTKYVIVTTYKYHLMKKEEELKQYDKQLLKKKKRKKLLI